MASQPTRPPGSTSSPYPQDSPRDQLDIPYDLDAPAQSDTNKQAPDPAPTIGPDNLQLSDILDKLYLLQLEGREAARPPARPPAMPARVTRRDDFPTVGASNRNGGRRDDSPPAKNLFHTFPPVPVPVEPRRQGDARATENLGGFDIEKMVATTIEYSRERRALREEITAVQRELARVASERNAERERILAWEGDLLELGLREVNRRTKTLAASMGFLFALGRALDQAQFPGKKFGMFNEEECSPTAYLTYMFPGFTRRPAAPDTPVDPMAPEVPLTPPHILSLIHPCWDVSMENVMWGDMRETLRDVWEASFAGNWEAAREKIQAAIILAKGAVADGSGAHGHSEG